MATRPVSLQDEHIAATRSRILDAVVELILHEHPASLSMPAVAERAGVSVRTVYRHFPTKQALLDAIADLGDQNTMMRFPKGANLANLREYMVDLWGELIHTKSLVLAQQATPIGQEIRKRRSKRRVENMHRSVTAEGVSLPKDDEKRLVVLLSFLLSRATLFELTDTYGLSVEESAHLASWAVNAVVEEAQRTKEVGR